GTSRVIVNLSAPARDGRYETEAHQWVALYRRAGRDAARQWREHFLRTAGAPTRSPSLPPKETIVLRCPDCVNTFAWTDDHLYYDDNSRYTPLQIPSNTDPRRRADLLRDAYKQCPHSSQDNRPHFLPVAYGSYRDPLVIGLVGAPKSGKTHLLTAMIAEIGRGGLLGYGLTAGPVDASRHRGFLDAYVRPLIATGAALSGTKEGQSRDFADA